MTNNELLDEILLLRSIIKDAQRVFNGAAMELLEQHQGGRGRYHSVDQIRCSLWTLVRELNDAEREFNETNREER
jgi:hypothetical protein